MLPQAVAELPENLRRRLRIVHQVRKPDMRAALKAYGDIGVYAEIRDFFNDLPTRMRRAHLVIGRGGASTMAEIGALGAPAIIVPLPGSLTKTKHKMSANWMPLVVPLWFAKAISLRNIWPSACSF